MLRAILLPFIACGPGKVYRGTSLCSHYGSYNTVFKDNLLTITLFMFLPSPSIISFQDAYVDYFIPKTYFNDTDKSYYASITTCVHVAHNSNPGIFLLQT